MAARPEDGIAIVEAATGHGIVARLMGGLAIAARCPSAAEADFARGYSDVDVATVAASRGALGRLVEDLGYQPVARFNAINGSSRLMFVRDDGGHLDVFVDRVRMCHTIDLAKRIDLNQVTIPLADLLLTKLQVAAITVKDVQDICVLLLDHELRADDEGVNASYIASLLAQDWGFWRTVTDNLRVLREELRAVASDASHRRRIAQAIDELSGWVERRPKSLRWKARAILGDRVAWREEPEEARR